MSYENQSGFPGSVQNVGSKIAGNQGGFQYESKPGPSLSGGAAPERTTFEGLSGTHEPGFESVTAPSQGGSYTGGHIESSGGSTYTPSSLGQQGTGTGHGQTYGSSAGIGSGTGGSRPGDATIGGAGINKETTGYGSGGSGTTTGSLTSGSGTTTGTTGGSTLQQTAANVQRTAEPYIAQAKEVAAPYVAKAQEVGSAALENARPMLNQAADVAAQAGQVGKEQATRAYNAAATELDARGINMDTTQQKLTEVGQTMKDYGAVGQQRAGEYFQQAVDQAKNIGQDGENKSIVATIFGTVFLVWLAFGFSIGAVFALGVAGSIAAVLSRYSRGHGSARVTNTSSQPYSQSTGQQPYSQSSSQQTASQSYGQPSAQGTGTSSGLGSTGVETHYPRPAHPDNSLHTNLGQ